MPRVVHFEINAEEPERAVAFYERVFGWKITKWKGEADYWLVTTGDESEPGINGGIMRRMSREAGTYNTVNVPSLDEFLKKIEEAGGEVFMAKRPVPGVGYMAYCSDTEGNIFGIMQEDPTASCD